MYEALSIDTPVEKLFETFSFSLCCMVIFHTHDYFEDHPKNCFVPRLIDNFRQVLEL